MHTVLSAFNDIGTARRAIDRLAQAGFDRADMHLQHRDVHVDGNMSRETWDGMEREIAMDRSVLESVGHFFVSLFGKDHPSRHAQSYSEVIARGECVVVVDADDEAQAHRAAEMLDEWGGRDRNIVPRSSGHRRVRDIVTEPQT